MSTQVAHNTRQQNGIAGALAATTQHLLTAIKELAQISSCPPEYPMHNANFWSAEFQVYFFGSARRSKETMHTNLAAGNYPIGFLRERIAQINELIVDEAKRKEVQHKLIKYEVKYAESEYDVESF